MKTACALLLVSLCTGIAQAQTLYRWLDADGKVHYGDRPPPPGKAQKVEEKRLSAPAADQQLSFALRQASEKFPVTLYVANACPVCQTARDYLRARGIPFTEKGVSTPEEIAELSQRLGGGEAAVPVLLVGEEIRKGFLDSAWGSLLDAAAYPKSTLRPQTGNRGN
jgi:glutaredoxin